MCRQRNRLLSVIPLGSELCRWVRVVNDVTTRYVLDLVLDKVLGHTMQTLTSQHEISGCGHQTYLPRVVKTLHDK